ncbi:hypothetical protein QR680_006063 [Steinernema hermaphroditum]|uniref:Uncharacterized protein n=1 Tax=Steinernema hermaphroditum TaxID=289476 RepID=A0AA39HVA0_9BILA|nr:hypothetical protein QR680_006063 [Steinernema hermaphroditum]
MSHYGYLTQRVTNAQTSERSLKNTLGILSDQFETLIVDDVEEEATEDIGLVVIVVFAFFKQSWNETKKQLNV